MGCWMEALNRGIQVVHSAMATVVVGDIMISVTVEVTLFDVDFSQRCLEVLWCWVCMSYLLRV
jgi:hypothetical protein